MKKADKIWIITGTARGFGQQISKAVLATGDLVIATVRSRPEACAELCRQIGNSGTLRPFVGREVIPGNLERPELENYIRDTAFSFWHQSSTAQMGRHAMCVVDGDLKVYGVDNLRIADGSIMPRVTNGNTMAPCVIVGERAAEIIRDGYQIGTASVAARETFPISATGTQ